MTDDARERALTDATVCIVEKKGHPLTVAVQTAKVWDAAIAHHFERWLRVRWPEVE